MRVLRHAALSALCLLSQLTPAGATELIFQGVNAVHPSTAVYLQTFADIKAATNGEADIAFLPMGSIVKVESAYTALRDGMMDFAQYNPQYTASIFAYGNAVSFPWIAKDIVHGTRVIETLIREIPEIQKELTKDTVFLGAFGSDRNAFLGNKPILSPADLKGMRVLTWLPSLLDELKAYGATPVMIGISDAYIGLQRGLGDAVYASLPTFRSLKLNEVGSHITVVPPSSILLQVVGANADSFADLPESVQAAISARCEGLGMRVAQAIYDGGNADLDYFRAQGLTVHIPTNEETAAFRDASKPAMRAVMEKTLREYGIPDPGAYMDRVDALAAQVR